jgi:hypothetical protein
MPALSADGEHASPGLARAPTTHHSLCSKEFLHGTSEALRGPDERGRRGILSSEGAAVSPRTAGWRIPSKRGVPHYSMPCFAGKTWAASWTTAPPAPPGPSVRSSNRVLPGILSCLVWCRPHHHHMDAATAHCTSTPAPLRVVVVTRLLSLACTLAQPGSIRVST